METEDIEYIEDIKNRQKYAVNIVKWKNYIRSKLALNYDYFVEIPIDNNTDCTMVDTNKFFDFTKGEFTNIEKNTLMYVMRELCKEYSYKYFITSRSMYNSPNYYIVLSFIH